MLGDIFVNGRWMIVSLSSSGEVWTHLKEDVMFDLPSIVPHDLALRCGLEAYGENDTEINARVALLKRIRQLELALAELQHKLGNHMRSVYPQVSSPNPDEWTRTTVVEAAKILAPDEPFDFLTRFAIHKHMMDRPKEFVADSLTYRTTQMFHVRPKSHLDRLNKLHAFIHQPEGPLQSFASRARRIMAENQQRAKESWAEPLSERPRDRQVFTHEDGIIIKFLRDYVRITREIQLDPYPVIVSKIVKTIGGYEGDVDSSLVCRLLIDLGAMAPWQDIVTTERELGLEQEPEELSSRVVVENAIIEKARATLPTTLPVSGEVLGPEDFYTNDLLESVRHDFGNLAVYVIDDAGAEELDDGISIEKIPSEPDCVWIHVHIADPTAVLPPTHVFARQARERVITGYFGHRTWPLLPRAMTHTLVTSVGEKAAAGKPERVMSFSFKVDGTGDIVDHNVRAGIIRNAHRTTYDAVDQIIGHSSIRAGYPFGGQPQLLLPTIDLTEQQQADLRAVHEVAVRMFKRTLQLPVFTVKYPKAEIFMSPKPLYTSTVDPLKPPIFRGFPDLSYTVDSLLMSNAGSRLVIGQCMTAAGRVASRWALDRGVPLLRRTAAQTRTMSDNDFEELLASKDEQGIVAGDVAMSKEIYMPAAEYTLQPGMHWTLGIPDGEGYVRVTSPLRRYSDMVTHWQIKHALLHPTSRPMFSPEWLQDYGNELIKREKLHRNAVFAYNHFWALRFIQRWMENPRPYGPDPLAHLVGNIMGGPRIDRSTNDCHAKVFLPELGLRAFVSGLRGKDLSNFTPGQAYNLKVKEIKLGVRPHLVLDIK